ncbi:MAG: hypothetical protein ABSE69_13825 [Roseiarcus sp.]|jgi:hypothetical protein
MVGITLSPEQIRAAPPEVRRWLEREIAASFNVQPEPPAIEADSKHLVRCGPEEAAAIFASIRGMLPVVNTFFEFGREGESIGQEGVEAYRLADMLRHTRLQSLEQLGACLQVIDEAVRRVRNDANATLYALDRRGYCVIATATQQSILAVWRQVIAGHGLGGGPDAAGPEAARAEAPAPVFPSIFGAIPPAALHMAGSAGTAARPAGAGVEQGENNPG